MIVVAAFIGVGILLYPTAAAWFSDRVHATQVSGYVGTVKSLPSEAKQKLLDDARAYNSNLAAGPLRDPYTLNAQGEQVSVGAGADAYNKLLNFGSEAMMGQVNIPLINVHLPIFHGTDEDTLSKGVGHLFGSSLPVGGTGTHSVLTAHSGFLNATFFNNLNTVKEGDVFDVTVLDETLYYKVNQILTVKPEDTQALRQAPGKDYVTLVTCTPTGVNSHRLLVRGERIDAPAAESGGTTVPGNATAPGFPWWMVIIAGTAVGMVIITKPKAI